MAGMYGLIFDVDGVIADTEAVNAKASIEMFEELFGLRGVQRKDFEKGLGRGAAEYVRAAARVHGLELDDLQVAQATKIRQEKFLHILQQNPLPAFEGVLELINAALERDDFRLAIATSGTREKSEAVLKSAKIPYEKCVYITGSDVKNKKPDPELFLAAAELAGVAPAGCAVIEDAPDGIAAAKAAGAKCIAVTNSTTADKLAQADMVVDSLKKLNLDKIVTIINGQTPT